MVYKWTVNPGSWLASGQRISKGVRIEVSDMIFWLGWELHVAETATEYSILCDTVRVPSGVGTCIQQKCMADWQDWIYNGTLWSATGQKGSLNANARCTAYETSIQVSTPSQCNNV